MTSNDEHAYEETPLIVAEKLVMEYRMSPTHFVPALSDVSFSIWRGEFVAIAGPSGSGKSSLLQLLGCLDRPTSGTIYIDGENVTELPTNRLPGIRGEKLGFIFQAHHLVPTLTAIENVMLPLRYRKVPHKEAEQLAGEWLVRVGLGDRMYHRPSELSGGEQQRVAIARALVNNPIIILADEPTGELDSNSTRDLIELMRGLNYAFGQTYLIATHDDEVAQMCDRILRLRDGKIVEDAVPEHAQDGYGTETDTPADGTGTTPGDAAPIAGNAAHAASPGAEELA